MKEILLFNMKYIERASLHTNPTAIKLLKFMDKKKTNLCVAADLTTKDEILLLAETLGPYICVFKVFINNVDPH